MLTNLRPRGLATGVFLLVASSSALAQTPPFVPCDFPDVPDGLEYKLDLPGTAHGDACTGEFTGDLELDIAVLIDGAPVVFHSPGTIDFDIHPNTLETTVTALCSLSGGGPGGIDRIVGSDAGGLVLWTLNTTLSELEPTRVLSSAAAANSNAVMTAALDSENGDDIVAVNTTTNTVTYWLQDTGGNFSNSYTYTATETIVKALIGDWVAGGAPELILVHAGRVSVIDTATSLEVETLSFTGTAEFATILNETSIPGFAVAVVEARPGPTQWLTLWRAGGNSEAGINLGTLGIIGITSGDVDAEGNEDPVVAATQVPWLILFPSQIGTNKIANGPTLDVQNAFASAYAPHPNQHPNQVSPPISADIDGDGDLDAAIACTLTGELDINLNGLLVPESVMRPILKFQDVDLDDPRTDPLLDSESIVTVMGKTPVLLPANFTHVEAELREINTIDTIDRSVIEIPAADSWFTLQLGAGFETPPSGAESEIIVRFLQRIDGVDVAVGPSATATVVHYNSCTPPVDPLDPCAPDDGTTPPPPIPKPIVGKGGNVTPKTAVPKTSTNSAASSV